MEPLLILFDVDGTLVDTAGAGRRALEQALSELFEVPIASSGVAFAGKTDVTIIGELLRANGLDHEISRARDGFFAQSYLRALREQMRQANPAMRVLPGVGELLDDLQGRPQLYLGLQTGNIEAGARAKLERFDLNRYFASGGFGSDHQDRREVVRIARDKLAEFSGIPFPRSRVVVIGDTLDDVDAAKANDFRSVAMATGWTEPELLERAEPDFFLKDLVDRERTLEALGVE